MALTCSTLPLCASEKNLGLGTDQIYTISLFAEGCYFTTFSQTGDPLWEVPFQAEILSWEASDTEVFVFSKARNGSATYLTCINKADGQLKWERSIVAPSPSGG